jgi:ZIP family zinc transporter
MGMSRWKSFMYGQSSALVEPIAAVLGAFAVTFSHQFYPMLWRGRCHDLCGGREVIPETQQDNNTDIATMGLLGIYCYDGGCCSWVGILSV